jgi:multidrug resistance efflux pump
MKRSIFTIIFLISTALLSAGCSVLNPQTGTGVLKASGTITVESVLIAPEIGGKLTEISAAKGSQVKKGDLLFKLDDQLLQAQQSQAQAAVQAAQANLDLAQQRLSGSQTQLDQALQVARQQNRPERTTAWEANQSDKIDLPVWYFEKNEVITALQTERSAAQANLDIELSNLERELKNASNSDFIQVEQHLAEAQQAYLIAVQVLDQAKAAKNTVDLSNSAQKQLDSAQSELDAAQKSYDQMLTGDSANRVREARSRVAVARERLNVTQDKLDAQLTGSDSLAVKTAQSGVDQASTNVSQAEAALAQAQAGLKLVQVQLAKTSVTAPISGIVLSRPINAGETVSAGTVVVEIGNLDQVTLTVFIPENLYGQIRLGQKANITVDSYSGRTFAGSVAYIADQAEFTPRNVQTIESRSSTVYKVEISITNPDGELKPGMPADAVFK